MSTLDLNAKRAARAAQQHEPMRLVVDDQSFDLVREMPIELADLANNNDISGALKMLLARPDEDWDRLRSCKPSYQDVMDVVEFFGSTLGESLPSAASSNRTGARSTLTGGASTGQALPQTSTERIERFNPTTATIDRVI